MYNNSRPIYSPRKLYRTPLSAELRSQLNEQLRALDCRIDSQCALVTELQEWFRRRAELHQDYSVKLDKLAKSLLVRHKEQKVKREQWSLFSVYNCWQILVNQTKRDARDHSAMADVYLNNIIPRFTQVQEDVQRIYKKCRDIGYESHEELLKVLHELHTTMRTYHMYQAEFKSAEGKLQNLEAQKSKLEQTNPKEKLEKRKKFKVIEKEIEKRKLKYRTTKLNALKARNEYILSMDSANAAIHKYFVEDLSDIIDCMDFGFHSSIAKALMTHISGQECFKRTLHNGIDDLSKSINNMDSRLDKQRFLEYNNAAFMLPKKFDFQGHKGDETNQVLVTHPIQDEMEKRYDHIVSRLTNLKTESEETWKTIETAEKTLLQMINARDYDIAHYFTEEQRVDTKTPEAVVVKRKADRQETEEFYLGKFRDYTLGSNLICRLQARFELMRKAIGDENQATSSPTPTRNLVVKPRRRRIGRTPLMGQPRLFGGSLEEYLEATGQEIPLIIKSCIRVINLFGLHHQGIFRVSGSQVEINNFRETFEKMEDPLSDVTDASDINSTAGVLKLYLRELREPIFPTVYFEQFMEIAQLESKQEFVNKVREVVMCLPRPVFVVMRYLFAFLNHLSEFSDENMMDPYNLAICFGPTLVPIPEDKDQVQYQNLVNELIKNIIIFFEDIFPYDGGPIYEKFISRDSLDFDAEVGDAPADDPDTVDSEPGQSEDESEILEAVAQFDFNARSERELSFSKGQVLLLHSQVSSDWWRGSIKGKTGLIPDKYILLKIRDEDKDRSGDRGGTSEESQSSSGQRRASSSSESIRTSSSNLSEVLGRTAPNGGSPGASASPFTTKQERNQSPSLLDGQSIGGSSSPVPSLSSLSSSGGTGDGGDSPSERGVTTFPPLSSPGGGSARLLQPSDEQEEVAPEIPKHGPHSGIISAHAKRDEIPVRYNMSTDSGSSLPLSSALLRDPQITRLYASDPPTTRLCTSMPDPTFGVTVEVPVTPLRPMSESSLSSEEKLAARRAAWGEAPAQASFGTPVVGVGAPDLVMDLPIAPLSSSPKEQHEANGVVASSKMFHHRCDSYGSLESSSGAIPQPHTPEGRAPSPGTASPDMTAAECFAKQNQSTLKKSAHGVKLSAGVDLVGVGVGIGGGSCSDAQTQTLTPMKVSASISTESSSPPDTPTEKVFSTVTSLEESHVAHSLTTTAKNLDAVEGQIEAEQPQPPGDDLIVEVRPMVDITQSEVIVPTPSTPKLAARYLKAVAASGGGSGVAVKPQVRIKPSVLKKPSLPPSTGGDSSASEMK